MSTIFSCRAYVGISEIILTALFDANMSPPDKFDSHGGHVDAIFIVAVVRYFVRRNVRQAICRDTLITPNDHCWASSLRVFFRLFAGHLVGYFVGSILRQRCTLVDGTIMACTTF